VLVASKYYAPEQVGALAAVGVDLVGENRAEDLVEKQERFGDAFEWHFIGHLQRRKAKIVAPRVGLIHSVDSVKLVEELGRRGAGGWRGGPLSGKRVGRGEQVRRVGDRVEELLRRRPRRRGGCGPGGS
jgi:hypothetical protein